MEKFIGGDGTKHHLEDFSPPYQSGDTPPAVYQSCTAHVAEGRAAAPGTTARTAASAECSTDGTMECVTLQ